MAKLGPTHEFANWTEEIATPWSLESAVNEERASAQPLRHNTNSLPGKHSHLRAPVRDDFPAL